MNRVLGSLLLLATVARSADNIHNVTNRWDVFWQLADLDAQFPNKSGSVYLGSQNYTWCCLKAVYVGLDILENKTLIIANNSITKIGTSTTGDLQDAALRSQFPCDAKYNDVSSETILSGKVTEAHLRCRHILGVPLRCKSSMHGSSTTARVGLSVTSLT